MEKVLSRVLYDDPFIPEVHHSKKPLYAALVPDEIFKGSHFERRFVSPFGRVWEQMAVVVAQERHKHCVQNKDIDGVIMEDRLRRITEVLSKLEHPGRGNARTRPNWEAELGYILKGKGKKIPVSVTCDLYIESHVSGKAYSFELKGPLPNSDQTKVSKEKAFKLLAMEQKQVDEAYFALPYNPYGTREAYQWEFPMRWFDMNNDPCVLIGDEFWDLVGGAGTYDALVSTVNALGAEYRERIYRDYLGVEPPAGSVLSTLR
jgi:hypothetical protein